MADTNGSITEFPISTRETSDITAQQAMDGIKKSYKLGVDTKYLSDFSEGLSDIDDIIDAAFSGISDKQTLVFDSSYDYSSLGASHDLDLSDKSVCIDFNGQDIKFLNGEDGFSFTGGWKTVQDCDGFGESGDVVEGVADTSDIDVKSYVRVYSNDVNPMNFSSNAYQAEDVYVESKTSDSLTIFGKSLSYSGVLSKFTSSPRVAQRNGNTVLLVNGTIGHDESASIVSFNSDVVIRCDALINPVLIDINVPFAVNPSIEFRACINGVVYGGYDGPHGDYNYDGGQVRGYGIRDCSTGTKIYNRLGKRLRHAIDTHEQAYGSQTNPSLYGSSVGLRAINCTAFGTTDTTFTTHHSCIDAKYIGCSAHNSRQFGYGARADVSFHDCTSISCFGDWNTFDEGGANPAKTKARFFNHKSIGCGPSRNACHETVQELFNYSATSTLLDDTILLKQNFDDCITKLNGNTYVSPSSTLDGTSTMFGNLISGSILFDYLEFDFTSEMKIEDGTTQYSRFIDCRGTGSPVSFYKMIGNRMRIRGAAIRSFLSRDLSYPVDTGQLKFNVAFDDGVLVYSGGEQSNLTNILYARDEDSDYASSILVVSADDIEAPSPVNYQSVTLDLGTADSGDLVEYDLAFDGLNSQASYRIIIDHQEDGLSIYSAFVSDTDTITIRGQYIGAGSGVDLSSVLAIVRVSL